METDGEKTLLLSTSDGGQLRKVTFQVANVKQVSKMVRYGNRVFDTSGSYIENTMTEDILRLEERDDMHVVDMMVAPPGRERKGEPLLGEAGGACIRACKSK